MNIVKTNFTNSENSYKIIENIYNDNFFAVVIKRKKNLYSVTVATNICGIRCTLSLCEEDLDKDLKDMIRMPGYCPGVGRYCCN